MSLPAANQPPSSFFSLEAMASKSWDADAGTAPLPIQMRGPSFAESEERTTRGRVRPVDPKARRAAQFAAAAFSDEVGSAGTTIFPFMASAMRSPLVSTNIQPGEKALAR